MEETETIDKTSEIAKETMVTLEKAEKAAEDKTKETEDKKVKEESKDASSEDSSSETKKTEGTEEEKKQAETTLLESDDKDLSDEDKTRKTELVKAKEDAKSPEEKQKDWQDNVNKRIGELSGELKAEKNGRTKDADTIKTLEDTIANLRGDLESAGSIESDNDKMVKSETEVYAKMVEEDKDLPKEQRREMSESELEEFLLEEPVKAQRWMAENVLRRSKDLEARKAVKQASDDSVKSVKDAVDKLFTTFPECDQETRGKALIAEGKTEKEAMDIIMAESPDFKLMMDVMKDNPTFADQKNPEAPALLMKEMEKRKSESVEKPKTYSVEEMEKIKEDAAVKERERIASIDVGLTSSASSTTAMSNDPLYKKGLDIFIMAGKRKGQVWTEKDYKETLEYGDKLRKATPL